ncbi:hypothetical protein [Bdellovibrio bacteriovorus]|uniref:hypothetical protein n=1 Tax=Bdellovibrio TaxID=958 RepID=UPI0035A90406
MVKDQIFSAKNEFELYEALRKNVSVDDFIDGQIIVGHIRRASESTFILDEVFIHNQVERVFEFQAKFPDEDYFYVLDSRGDFEEMSFGGTKFTVTLAITEVSSWVLHFSVLETNKEFDEHIERQVKSSFSAVTKKITG